VSSTQDILKQYELVRRNNKEELEQRKQNLYSRIPRLKEIEDLW
jgi:hypothetical protein